MTMNNNNNKHLRTSGRLSRLCLASIFIMTVILTVLVSCKSDNENNKTEITKKVRVRVEKYQKTEYELSLNFSGDVKAWKMANLSFNVQGKIDSFYFDEGQKVKKDDLLAELEQDDYKALKDQSHAQWEKANRDYERSQRLLEKGTIREQLVQDASTAFKASKAALDSAELNLKHCLLKAPFQGHIAYRFSEEKEMVSPGQVVFTLMDLSKVLVEVGVPENSISRLRKGQIGSVFFEAIPEKIFSGKVTHVGVSSLPNTRLFKVEMTIPNPNLIIKPGMTASSTIITDKIHDVFVFSLDITALRNGKRILFIADNGVAKKVILDNYIISGDKIIIRDSLPEGKQVITSGQDVLFDGMQISVIQEGPSQ